MKLLQIKRHAPDSVRSYAAAFWVFAQGFPGRDVGLLSAREVENFISRKLTERHSPVSFRKSLAGVYVPRHAYTTHLTESGVDIRILQTQPGHASIRSTRNYTLFARARLQTSQCSDNEMVFALPPHKWGMERLSKASY